MSVWFRFNQNNWWIYPWKIGEKNVYISCCKTVWYPTKTGSSPPQTKIRPEETYPGGPVLGQPHLQGPQSQVGWKFPNDRGLAWCNVRSMPSGRLSGSGCCVMLQMTVVAWLSLFTLDMRGQIRLGPVVISVPRTCLHLKAGRLLSWNSMHSIPWPTWQLSWRMHLVTGWRSFLQQVIAKLHFLGNLIQVSAH